MANIILMTGGRGGVGKTVVSALTGRALAKFGQKVLLVEGGQRSVDTLFDLDERVVYDLGDLLEGRCAPGEAVLEASDRMHVICGPVGAAQDEAGAWERLLEWVEFDYDVVLVEIPSTRADWLTLFAPVCGTAVVVSPPSRPSARDSRAVTDLLARAGAQEIRLCVNMLNPGSFQRNRPIPDLDWLIDAVCAQLIAVVAFDPALVGMGGIEQSIQTSAISPIIFDNFAQRILGHYIDLWIV